MEYTKAFLFGLTLAFTVGPMTLLIVQRAVTHGRGSAIATACGLAAADGIWAVVTFVAGSMLLSILTEYDTVLRFVSGCILLVFAVVLSNSALRTYRSQISPRAANATGGAFASALFLTLHNPLTILLFASFLGSLDTSGSLPEALTLAALVMTGSLLGQLTIALVSLSVRRFFASKKALCAMNLLSATAIACFGALSIARTWY